MEHVAFWEAGRRWQLNWTGPGHYMVVENEDSTAVWPARWEYVARRGLRYIAAPSLDVARLKLALLARRAVRSLYANFTIQGILRAMVLAHCPTLAELQENVAAMYSRRARTDQLLLPATVAAPTAHEAEHISAPVARIAVQIQAAQTSVAQAV